MKFIISAGGTGGHIYPAIAIINKILKKEPNSEFIYIGTKNRMESEIIPKLGYKYIGLEIYGFNKRKPIQCLKNLFLIKKDIKICEEVMRDFKPDVVIGVGGYVTYPVITSAHKLGIKTFIHEQNAIPGKSNKALQKYTDLIGVSFENSKDYFTKTKVVYTGNPCGSNAVDAKMGNVKKYGLSSDKKLVLFVSGSLGSQTINEKCKEFLQNATNEYNILYVTGKNLYDEFIKNVKFPSNVKVVPYIDNLSEMLKVTDILVSRAGASTISEVIALKLPTLFIPSPYVANNHQYYNALSMKEKKAADMIIESELNSEILNEKISELLNNGIYYNEVKSNLARLFKGDSAELIYKNIKDLIK